MPQKLRLGMIGVGEIAYKATAKSVGNSERTEMIVGMDVVEDVAKSFAEEYDTEWTTSIDEVLGRDDIDAVVISTPHCLHSPQAILAAEAGKHAMVEKPIACTMAQADAMIEACKKAGVVLTVALISRYSPGVVKAKELIEAGAIGEIIALRFTAAGDKADSYWTGGFTGRVQTTWRKSKNEAGGGILIMNLVHDIDRLRYITGLEATRVYAEGSTFCTDVEVEDFISVTLRYENGAVGNMLASSCARGGRAPGNRIYGSHGQIIFEGRNSIQVYTTKDVPGLESGAWNEVEVESNDSRAVALDRFAAAILDGEPVDIPGEEGRKTLEVILAAYESAESGEPVVL
jgi:predicted dehydrogenase